MPSRTPELSVVIPTRNRRALIARTLPTVLEQNIPPEQYEVVVVSDGSTDGTVEFLRNVKTTVMLRVIDRPHRGIAATQNVGIKAADGALVMVLDDDILCEPTLLRQHILAHKSDRSCIVFGPRLISPESRPGLATEMMRRWYRNHFDQLIRNRGPQSRFDVWLDSNFSAPRDLLLAHGGYDESFACAEDYDLAMRLWKAGARFHFMPNATVYEIYSKSADDLVLRDALLVGADEVKLCRKHSDYIIRSRPVDIIGHSKAKLIAFRFCSTVPFSAELLLQLLRRAAEFLSASPTMLRVGLRILEYRKSLAVFRSAIREAGSWHEFEHEFSIWNSVSRQNRLKCEGSKPTLPH